MQKTKQSRDLVAASQNNLDDLDPLSEKKSCITGEVMTISPKQVIWGLVAGILGQHEAGKNCPINFQSNGKTTQVKEKALPHKQQDGAIVDRGL